MAYRDPRSRMHKPGEGRPEADDAGNTGNTCSSLRDQPTSPRRPRHRDRSKAAAASRTCGSPAEWTWPRARSTRRAPPTLDRAAGGVARDQRERGIDRLTPDHSRTSRAYRDSSRRATLGRTAARWYRHAERNAAARNASAPPVEAGVLAVRGEAAPPAIGERASGSRDDGRLGARRRPAASTRLGGCPRTAGRADRRCARAPAAKRRASPGRPSAGQGFCRDDGARASSRSRAGIAFAASPAPARSPVSQRPRRDRAARARPTSHDRRATRAPRERARASPSARGGRRGAPASRPSSSGRGAAAWSGASTSAGIVGDRRDPRPGMDLPGRVAGLLGAPRGRASEGRGARRRGVAVTVPLVGDAVQLSAGRRPAISWTARGTDRSSRRPEDDGPGRAGAARGNDGHPQRRRRGTGRPARPLRTAARPPRPSRERLVEREHPVVERLLAADPRGEVARVVHPQLEAARR